MATATLTSVLPPLMQARENEKNNEFPCDMKQNGQKCQRRFHRVQALGRHKATVHAIPGKTAVTKAKRTATKKARNGKRVQMTARKATTKTHSSPASGKTRQVIEMTAANHPQIGTMLRVTGLAEGEKREILMLLTHEDHEWKVVLS